MINSTRTRFPFFPSPGLWFDLTIRFPILVFFRGGFLWGHSVDLPFGSLGGSVIRFCDSSIRNGVRPRLSAQLRMRMVMHVMLDACYIVRVGSWYS